MDPELNSECSWPNDLPRVLLVGSGVVGRAIAHAHASRDVAFCLADQSADALSEAQAELTQLGFLTRRIAIPIDGLQAIAFGAPVETDDESPLIVAESIVERLDAKQDLFAGIESQIQDEVIFCTNTSTLQIEQIAGNKLQFPERVCGLHFFMPVQSRAAVEVVAGRRTDRSTIDQVIAHAKRLGKHPIECGDGPGFIVNRMLSPYLNQALLLLCRGAKEDQIQRAARAYGMPMSPLELIDWIGTPTMYHAGRAFINAFPKRMNPSPMVPALVKRKRFGRSTGAGLYDYSGGERSDELATQTTELIEMYRADDREFTDGEVLQLLSIPMWIEATCLLNEGIAESMGTVDFAMAGGLGYTGHTAWSEFFRELGTDQINAASTQWGNTFRSMVQP